MRSVKGLSRGTLPSDSAAVEVVPVLQAGARRPRSGTSRSRCRPVVRIRSSWWSGLAALGAAGWLAWRARRRAPVASVAPAVVSADEPLPPDPYDDRASAVSRPSSEEGWATRDVARHYEAVADALRDYLEAHGVPARERTTYRAPLGRCRPRCSRDPRSGRFEDVFEEADLVKFAHWRPTVTEADAVLSRARDLLTHWHAAHAAGADAQVGDAIPAREAVDAFADPAYLAAALGSGRAGLVPVARAGAGRRTNASASRRSRSWRTRRSPARSRWPWLPDALRTLGLALLIVALARPQVPHEVRQIRSKSRNIMIALDISSSMKAGDFKPGNRLMVARRVLADFTRETGGRPARPGHLRRPRLPAGAAHARRRSAADDARAGSTSACCPTVPRSAPRSRCASPSSRTCRRRPASSCSSPTAPTTPASRRRSMAAEAARAIGVRIHTIGVSAADTTGARQAVHLALGRPHARPPHLAATR